LSVLAFDFFLVPPYLTFAVSDTEYFITFAVMAAVALFMSTVTGRLFAFADATRTRELRLQSMYRVSRLLIETHDQNEMLQSAVKEIEEFFRSSVLILVGDDSGKLHLTAGDAKEFEYSGNEIQTAEWVFRNIEPAGFSTDTLAGSKGTYFPLKGRERTMGVLGIRLLQQARLIEPEQMQLMETFAAEIAEALESKLLSEAAGRATASMETERLKNLVLRSFTYDVAGPAQEISATIKKIRTLAKDYSPGFRKAFDTLVEKSDQIERVVSRLPALMESVFPTSGEVKRKVTEGVSSKKSLGSWLAPDRIFFFGPEVAKKEILRTLVYSLPVADPSYTLREVEEREEAGGILVRPNVSIPHAIVDGISGVIAALGIQNRDPENGETSPHFWLLFVSGSESMKEHLQFLQTMSVTLTDEVMMQLSSAANADEIFHRMAAGA
jgi:mannitol/fructose-specific phosphotransferase system IIA component (Ntr-type)